MRKYSVSSKEAYLASHKRKVKVSKKEVPKTSKDLKENIKACIKDDKMPVVQADDREQTWQTFQELLDFDVFLLDCRILNDDMKKKIRETPKANLSDSERKEMEELLKSMQDKIGHNPKLEIERFENWAETIISNVISCWPTSKEEIQTVIAASKEEGLKIRCAGSRHSWAPVFSDERQMLLNLGKLRSDYGHGVKIRIANRSRNEVDVMAGVTTGELKDFQLKNKLHLPASVIIDAVTVVGIVSAGCHGVGRYSKSISDYVVKMRVFDSKGELRTYSNENQAMFRAVMAGFGCFGVVYDITLKMEPEFLVKTENVYYNLGEVFCYARCLQSIVENNWSTNILWFPYNSLSCGDYNPKNDELWVRVTNKAPPDVDTEDWDYYTWRDTKDYVTQGSLAAMLPLLVEDPSIVPYFSWTGFKLLKYVMYPSGEIYQEHPHSVHFRKHIDMAPVYDMEFIFDYDDDYEKLLQIIHVVVKRVDHYEEKEEYPLTALEIRFISYSDAYLGSGVLANPATGGSGHVMCIEILGCPGCRGWDTFSTEVGKEWMDLGGVPHLAKQWNHLPGIYEHIQEKMSGPITSFKTQLKKSGADPDGMFLNENFKMLLGIL
ncbi:uncharacterized protein LOC133193568 [Saccostrea echinata]|uniref:uncharacterized protein LOC133193568 n=1 Tax=Saccostrea echinata TaxID=191078 RepID=UPI002A802EF8|nr:uncharacterized protein LOC133193568 [Saccostrea echinata]